MNGPTMDPWIVQMMECRVHSAPLVQNQSSKGLTTSKFGDFAFLMCPVNSQVVDEVSSIGHYPIVGLNRPNVEQATNEGSPSRKHRANLG